MNTVDVKQDTGPLLPFKEFHSFRARLRVLPLPGKVKILRAMLRGG